MMNTIVSLPRTVNGNDLSVVVLMISFALIQQEVAVMKCLKLLFLYLLISISVFPVWLDCK